MFRFKNIYTTPLKILKNVAFGVAGCLCSIGIFALLGVDSSTASGQMWFYNGTLVELTC
jgi:hypothetical protein